ncbi:hypothetical protein OCB09_21560 [Bacillus cereus]|nr:hypothetical protein [Bacillus cereus]
MSPFAGDSPLQGDGNQKRNIGPHADIGVCVHRYQPKLMQSQF